MNGEDLKRVEYIHFRASPAEYAALLRLARLEQTGISETMRAVLRQAARERGVWPVQEQQPEGVRHA